MSALTLAQRLRDKQRGWHPDQVEAADRIEALEAQVARMRIDCTDAGNALASVEQENERRDEALHKIKSWSEAYPLAVFPEPDFVRAHEVLTAAGMTLDAISASNMRHVITQVQAIVDGGLKS